jgi:alpha-D-xyloside xylohydrolase
MLGDGLLVAPVFNDGSMAEFYLPEGTWTNFLTGERRDGGRWYKEHCDYMSIPLYVKPGSIVAVGAREDAVVYDYADQADFRVYALEQGQEAACVIYGPEAELAAQISVRRDEAGYHIDYKGKACTVTLLDELGVHTVTMDGDGEMHVSL